jgi:xylulose-5-phosphate/fructose-6-phosphate phosphoketolase
MSANPHANGGGCCVTCRCRTSATTPSGRRSRRPSERSDQVLGAFLRTSSCATRHVPDHGPDETASNRLQPVFEETDRAWDGRALPATTTSRPTAG